jgi:hypothetical protein
MNKVSITSKRLVLLITAFVMITFSSCSKKMIFSNSSVVPAAVGTVKIKTDNNKNNVIEVNVDNLAPASKLSPPRETYVVWMVTENNETKNLGQLIIDTNFLSSSLKGSLKTISAYKPDYIFITAEDEGDVEYPGMKVLSTR